MKIVLMYGLHVLAGDISAVMARLR